MIPTLVTSQIEGKEKEWDKVFSFSNSSINSLGKDPQH
jgi:hypothetical protein